jgi:ABC-type multidrug transport system fused ATPase/permease subunit
MLPARGRFFLSMALTLAATLLTNAIALALQELTVRIKAEAPTPVSAAPATSSSLFALIPQSLSWFALFLVALVIVNGILRYLSTFLHTSSGNEIVRGLELSLHDRILRLGPDFHRATNVGETSTVVMNFSTGAQQMIFGIFEAVIVEPFGFVISVSIIVQKLSEASSVPAFVKLGLVAGILVFPLVGVILSGRLQRNSAALGKSYMRNQQEFLNSAMHPLEVQAMGAESQRSSSFGASLATQLAIQSRMARLTTLQRVFDSSAPILLQALFIAAVVSNPGKNGRIDPEVIGSIIIFIMLIPNAVQPVQSLVSIFQACKVNWPMVSRVFDFLEAEPGIFDCPDALPFPEPGSAISVKNLSFMYEEGGRAVYDNFSHIFQSGRKTAIAARLGMGKSTMMHILLRFYNQQEGSIEIDGVDIRRIRIRELRKYIVRVSQFPLFISDTVRANFLLANAESTDEEIIAACRKTGFWEGTLVPKAAGSGAGNPLDLSFEREEGGDWTGGERKVLAVTRALMLRPRILLLDEPTSGVDAFKAREIAELLKGESFHGITMIVVDHNPEFLEEICDEIVCVDEGKIVDVGTPTELMGYDSFFRRLKLSFTDEVESPRGESEARRESGFHERIDICRERVV